jgi:hypothetical protein
MAFLSGLLLALSYDFIPLVASQQYRHGDMGFEGFKVMVNKVPYTHAVGMHPAAFYTVSCSVLDRIFALEEWCWDSRCCVTSSNQVSIGSF